MGLHNSQGDGYQELSSKYTSIKNTIVKQAGAGLGQAQGRTYNNS